MHEFYLTSLCPALGVPPDVWQLATYPQNLAKHILYEKNSELDELKPSEIDIKIPKKFSKNKNKKIDLIVKN